METHQVNAPKFSQSLCHQILSWVIHLLFDSFFLEHEKTTQMFGGALIEWEHSGNWFWGMKYFLYGSICNSNQAVFVWSLIHRRRALPVMAHNFWARCWWIFPQTTLIHFEQKLLFNMPTSHLTTTTLETHFWHHGLPMKMRNKKKD